ncbi:MAG: PDDEXK nuclease domain-containing protein, partial [Lewinella sp.]
MTTPYSRLLIDLKSAIRDARYRAVRQVNRALIELYWEIGRQIVESQEAHGWGKSTVEELARDLRVEFPENSGLSERNLWHMRKFHLTYRDYPNLYTLCTDLSWSNNRELLNDNIALNAKAFYLKESAQGNWSFRTLHQQIKAQAYERSLLDSTQNNFQQALPEEIAEQTEELLKSSYNLDFLGLEGKFKEKDLEDRIVSHLQAFMLELGYGFTFVGRQQRLSLNKDYYVDLM